MQHLNHHRETDKGWNRASRVTSLRTTVVCVYMLRIYSDEEFRTRHMPSHIGHTVCVRERASKRTIEISNAVICILFPVSPFTRIFRLFFFMFTYIFVSAVLFILTVNVFIAIPPLLLCVNYNTLFFVYKYSR